jgi:hypothetical protein
MLLQPKYCVFMRSLRLMSRKSRMGERCGERVLTISVLPAMFPYQPRGEESSGGYLLMAVCPFDAVN